MDTYARRFVRASLLWLGFGVLLGVAMGVWPPAYAYRAAHVHANLLGFVSMMIFGVAYHVIPRFTGRPLHSRRLADAHVWVANAGLALLAGGFILRVHEPRWGTRIVVAGSLASAAGAYFFIYNIWRTIPSAAPAVVLPKSGAPRVLHPR
jgi:cbb3-type cytochrome oxidase subunit 1